MSYGITITGHRYLMKEQLYRIDNAFEMIMSTMSPKQCVYYSQLADGTDQLLMRIAQNHGHKICAVIPMGIAGFCAKDLQGIDSLAQIVSHHSTQIVEISISPDESPLDTLVRDKYYKLANEYMLEASSAVVAVYDGKESMSNVGTASVFIEGITQGKPVYWIPSTDDIDHKSCSALSAMDDIEIIEHYFDDSGILAYYQISRL